MKLIYLIHLVVVILGLILATKLYFNIKQGKFLPKTCPRIFGIGAGTFMFADSMIASILQRLLSEALEYTSIISFGLFYSA